MSSRKKHPKCSRALNQIKCPNVDCCRKIIDALHDARTWHMTLRIERRNNHRMSHLVSSARRNHDKEVIKEQIDDLDCKTDV